ncbi:metabolite traffic protein EboE [Oryzobacter sp. R7]|uniref:metabolite traffic protein EboE n=1 Tax=Oryzobacter faecalis TaxID=3388656 RepID=UPI00398CE793
MRLTHADGTTVHLGYCTNVHAGDDLDDVLTHLDRFCLPVRRHVGADLLGVGLWLAAPAARELARDPRLVAALRSAMAWRGLEVVTLNAFPYRGFQQPVVKHRVYHPDWSQADRLSYTVDCATVLAGLLPDDAARGSISTLPLAWRTPWDDRRARAARVNLARLAETLDGLEAHTGRTVRVGLEPEPGCVLETTTQAVAHLGDVDPRRVGVALDLCHLAVQFEDPEEAVARVGAAGLPFVKAQVSAALHAAEPGGSATRAGLEAFDEERFLHQVRGLRTGGEVCGRDDLPAALSPSGPLPDREEDGAPVPWRVHFHVPLDTAPEGPLGATTDHTRATLAALVGGEAALVDHLEVESYTWGVIPEAARPRTDDDLARGIAGELAWARDQLVHLGLKEAP